MAYILKNNTQAFLVTRVTDVGRKKISEGSFNIKYFQVGDSEVNYTANTLSTYNLSNLNILEPSFNAHNNTGLPQSNKNEIKYPYYLQGYSGSTYGIPFSDPIVDEVFNTATPLGFFTAGTTCYYPNYNSSYSYNNHFRVNANQFNSDTSVQMTVNQCPGGSSLTISSNTIVFIAMNNGTCDNCFTSCAPILTYRVTNYNNATTTITVDRATPSIPSSVGVGRAFFYQNSISGFDTPTPFNYFDTLNQDVINYESICSPYDGHVKIWNMNIPWSENPAGVNGAGGPTNYPNYTSYGSVNYLGTKEYYGYQSSLGQYFQLPNQQTATTDTYYYNSSGERIYVEPEEQKAIAILHYTNNSIINFYGEKFATEAFVNGGVGEARNFKVVIPHIMWHKNSLANLCKGLTLYIDPPGFTSLNLCQPHFMLSKKNDDMNTPGIRYFHLYDTNANPDGYPNRVGKVFPDDKLIIIDDEELIASLTYVANRNYTLPAPKLSLVTPTTNGILSNETQCLWVTYALSSGWNGLHCNYYSKILGPLSSCTTVSQNVDITFDGNFNGLVNYGQNNFNGFGAQNLYMLVQTGTTGSRPNPTQWKKIDFTSELSAAGAITSGYITQTGINTFTFSITPSKYSSAPFYNLSNQIQIPTITQLNYGIKPLNFGDEYFFYGTINTDIEATIYQMRYLINLPTNQFVKPSNPSWSEFINVETRMTEVGLYDDDKNLLVLSKFQSPAIRQGVQQIAIKLDF